MRGHCITGLDLAGENFISGTKGVVLEGWEQSIPFGFFASVPSSYKTQRWIYIRSTRGTDKQLYPLALQVAEIHAKELSFSNANLPGPGWEGTGYHRGEVAVADGEKPCRTVGPWVPEVSVRLGKALRQLWVSFTCKMKAVPDGCCDMSRLSVDKMIQGLR